MTEATVNGATFIEATMTEATVNAATVTEATVNAATITGANVTEETVTETTVNAATITGANMTEATVTEETVTETTVNAATITGANMTEATVTEETMTDDNNEAAVRQAALKEFRIMVEDEQDVYIGDPPDERFMIQYLKCTNYNVAEAFEKMTTLLRAKETYRDYFATTRDPEVHDAILELGVHQMLDYRDQLGRKIYVIRLGRIEFGTFQPCHMNQVDDLWFTMAIDDEDTQDNGIVILLDFAKVSWGILRMFTPLNAKAMTAKAEIVPVKNLQYHIVNAGYVLNTILKLTYPLISQATKDSIFVHKSLESLHEHISPRALPQEYGGERPPIHSAKLVREYLDPKNERISEVLSYGYRRS